MEGSTKGKENLAWDEKELSDFEVPSEEEGGYEEDESEELEGAYNKPSKAKVTKKSTRFDGGVTYPPDIWFLIGDWLHPEDVAVFSAICKDSHAVIHTARFWNSLYRRYTLRDDVVVPAQFQPRFMCKVHGLRTRIVKALFYVYNPFLQRMKSLVPIEQQLDSLEGYICSIMWSKRVKNSWHFFFKFKRRVPLPPCNFRKPDRSDHLWAFTPDIAHNQEEDCKVLQVMTTNFMALPVIMGHTLQKASVSVGHVMRYHKLRLIFTQQNGKIGTGYTPENGIVVVMDPVINSRLLRWWEPEYPGNMQDTRTPTTPPL